MAACWGPSRNQPAAAAPRPCPSRCAARPQNVAEIVGCINGAATVLILTLCLAAYGAVTFQGEGPQVRRLITVFAAQASARVLRQWLGCCCQRIDSCHPGCGQVLHESLLLTDTCNFHPSDVQVGVKTLSGRSIPRDPLQSAEVRTRTGRVGAVAAVRPGLRSCWLWCAW